MFDLSRTAQQIGMHTRCGMALSHYHDMTGSEHLRGYTASAETAEQVVRELLGEGWSAGWERDPTSARLRVWGEKPPMAMYQL